VVLAEPAAAGESLALEHRDGSVVEERRRGRAVRGVLRVALDGPAAETGDLVERTREGGGRDALPPVVAVDEEAGDPPIREGVEIGEVGAAVFDARELVGRAELAPADARVAVIDERRVRSALAHAAFLLGPVLGRRLVAADSLLVEAHAPAAAPDAVVRLDEAREVRPRPLARDSTRRSATGRRV